MFCGLHMEKLPSTKGYFISLSPEKKTQHFWIPFKSYCWQESMWRRHGSTMLFLGNCSHKISPWNEHRRSKFPRGAICHACMLSFWRCSGTCKHYTLLRRLYIFNFCHRRVQQQNPDDTSHRHEQLHKDRWVTLWASGALWGPLLAWTIACLHAPTLWVPQWPQSSKVRESATFCCFPLSILYKKASLKGHQRWVRNRYHFALQKFARRRTLKAVTSH